MLRRIGRCNTAHALVVNDIRIVANRGVDMPVSGRYEAKAGAWLPNPDARVPGFPSSQASVSVVRLLSRTDTPSSVPRTARIFGAPSFELRIEGLAAFAPLSTPRNLTFALALTPILIDPSAFSSLCLGPPCEIPAVCHFSGLSRTQGVTQLHNLFPPQAPLCSRWQQLWFLELEPVRRTVTCNCGQSRKYPNLKTVPFAISLSPTHS